MFDDFKIRFVEIWRQFVFGVTVFFIIFVFGFLFFSRLHGMSGVFIYIYFIVFFFLIVDIFVRIASSNKREQIQTIVC